MSAHALPFPRNPDYGHGATRRRVRVCGGDGEVTATLSDIFHEMHCRISHDGLQVTAVDAAMLRVPTTICPGAVAQLRALVGTPLHTAPRELYAGGRIREHCTHLFDLAVLAIGHARRGDSGEYCYEAVVPDALAPPVDVAVSLNGAAVHQWTLAADIIQAPAPLRGKSLFKGFSAWSTDHFQEHDWEAAMILARTCMIAGGRAYRTDAWKGEPIARNNTIIGACYSYAPERIDEGIFRGDNVRDFSQGVIEDTA